MTDLKNQEHLRDTIGDVLEMSRASWRLKDKKKEFEEEQRELEMEEGDFPRSILLKTLTQHPLASAATAAALWYVGPAKFGAIAFAGASLFMRHRLSILPIAEHLMTSGLFGSGNPFKTRKKSPPTSSR